MSSSTAKSSGSKGGVNESGGSKSRNSRRRHQKKKKASAAGAPTESEEAIAIDVESGGDEPDGKNSVLEAEVSPTKVGTSEKVAGREETISSRRSNSGSPDRKSKDKNRPDRNKSTSSAFSAHRDQNSIDAFPTSSDLPERDKVQIEENQAHVVASEEPDVLTSVHSDHPVESKVNSVDSNELIQQLEFRGDGEKDKVEEIVEHKDEETVEPIADIAPPLEESPGYRTENEWISVSPAVSCDSVPSVPREAEVAPQSETSVLPSAPDEASAPADATGNEADSEPQVSINEIASDSFAGSAEEFRLSVSESSVLNEVVAEVIQSTIIETKEGIEISTNSIVLEAASDDYITKKTSSETVYLSPAVDSVSAIKTEKHNEEEVVENDVPENNTSWLIWSTVTAAAIVGIGAVILFKRK
jgi:hypothetical protein